MTQKSMAYDNPAYIARLSHAYGSVAAGAAGLTGKFVAFTAMLAMSVTVTVTTIGTSTDTLWNGTSTITSIKGANFSLIRIFNTAAAGATPALATATYGPFVANLYNGTATGTQTAVAGLSCQVALGGTAVNGTGAQQAGAAVQVGGVPIAMGDQVYVVTGTDATQVSNYTLEYALQQFANVTA